MARIKHYNATTQKWEYSDISSAVKGDKGDKGDTGNTGATPKLTIGTVSTLAAGSNATATITGTTENPILNLGLPKGIDGTGAGMTDVFATGTTAPTNTKLLWISPTGLQYYNGSAWTHVPVAYT